MLIKRFKKNIEGNDYLIGDIHGYISDLYKYLDKIKFNKKKDRLFAVGDLIDRGPDNEMVLKLLKEPWFNSVRGNHEQMIIDMSKSPYFYDTEKYGAGWICFSPKSYQLKYAKEFNKLPYVIEVETNQGKIGVLHADTDFNDWDVFIKNVNSKDQKTLSSILWNLERFKKKDNSIVKNIDKIYVGHMTTPEVINYGNVFYIDLGICNGNPINLIVL